MTESIDATYPLYMVYSVMTSCLSSFSMGWVIGSPNVPGQITHQCDHGSAHINSPLFPDCLPMNDALWGFAVASFCVGGLIGGLFAGQIQTKLGRKNTIIINNIGYILGGLLIGLSVNVGMFTVGRIFCGLSCGIGSLTVPTYIGEVATIKARGAMGTCNQFFIVIGILLASVIGLPLATVPLWRVNYALVAIPALIQVFLMPTCVETPRYLVSINRVEDARRSLQKLRTSFDIESEFFNMLEGHFGTAVARTLINGHKENASAIASSASFSSDDVNKKADELSDISEKDNAGHHDNMNIIEIFKDSTIRRISITVILLHALQQLVGINAVMYYSSSIFTLAFDDNMAKYMAIITTVVNFVTTLIAVGLIDRMGRRPLLLIANFGACIFCILLVIGYVFMVPGLLVASVFLYVASFAIGIGPIPWMLTSEMTPTYASSSVGAVATCVNWTVNFIIGQTFPIVFSKIAGYSFAIFGIVAALAFVFTFLCLPETKGRTLEDVVRDFEKRK